MRFTQLGMPVKSIFVPLVDAFAVSSVNFCDSMVGVTVPVSAVDTSDPVLSGSVRVRVDAVLGSCRVTEPPPDELSLRLIG